MKFEKTCKCIQEYKIENLTFHKEREYQVDIYPLYYQLYQNGGWNDYVYINKEDFKQYFKLID